MKFQKFFVKENKSKKLWNKLKKGIEKKSNKDLGDDFVNYNFEKNDEKLIKVDKKKFNIESLKEIALVATAVVLIGIGYVNFSNGENLSVSTYAKSANNIGDVELVSSESVLVENSETEENSKVDGKESMQDENIVDNQDVQNNENIETSDVSSSTVKTTNSVDSYFTELKMGRDKMFSQAIATYQKIIDSTAISNEQKAIAVQEIEKISNTQKSILIAEELIKLKGFSNVVIYVNR